MHRRRNTTATTAGDVSQESNGIPNSSGDAGVKKPLDVAVVAPALLDLYSVLGLVFGGCCTNVWAYEELLIINPRIGSALTFSQMLFITLQSLPSFLSFTKAHSLPRLKPRQVPLNQWGLQVLVLTAGSLLNNWAFAYKVPLTVQIVFRSGSLAVSMLFGYLFLKKKYTWRQILSITIVTLGVILATLRRPSSASSGIKITSPQTPDELRTYAIGIMMLIISLFCTGLLGLLQEKTYRKYGPCWREGVFYTHALSLPVFMFLGSDITQGVKSLSNAPSRSSALASYAMLAGNLVSQLICVSGVNRLSSQISSVSTHIVLTARKAISLCLSVWWFGNDWNAELAIGASMVFFGSILYTTGNSKEKQQ
ncbi:UAA transporter [Macrolepiota fuliginosa MF-IS2]|uniref:UAA transporter n=1 Tax=Macrolepiota fuliginosa MF-IS2 TaxID=1400762 RepID=A0A9P5XQ08_9AGAR|nr:UAA transporter [Macrolepiota fuliginosa MF-IS2]